MINQKIEMTKFSTLEEWLDIQHQEYLNEWKNVGTIYHQTSLRSFLQIISNNTLVCGRSYNVSFTRNFNYEVEHTNGCIKLVVDGDKLSDHYKINPISNFGNTDEYEEMVNRDILFFNRY